MKNEKSIFAVLLMAVMFSALPSWGAPKPNVIIIFTDDQGSVDMNIYGSTDLTTPNMDQLARQGVSGIPSRVIQIEEGVKREMIF